MDENDEDLIDLSFHNNQQMSEKYMFCIIGQSSEGHDIYSWKKMIKVVKSFGMDENDAEDFLFRTSINFPEDIIILMDN